jgi:hypothetical protein
VGGVWARGGGCRRFSFLLLMRAAFEGMAVNGIWMQDLTVRVTRQSFAWNTAWQQRKLACMGSSVAINTPVTIGHVITKRCTLVFLDFALGSKDDAKLCLV